MPKITVQVSDKSLDFFTQLMKELKFKIVEDGKAPASNATAAPDADLMVDAPGDLILGEKAGKKGKRRDKDRDKDKKKKKK